MRPFKICVHPTCSLRLHATKLKQAGRQAGRKEEVALLSDSSTARKRRSKLCKLNAVSPRANYARICMVTCAVLE